MYVALTPFIGSITVFEFSSIEIEFVPERIFSNELLTYADCSGVKVPWLAKLPTHACFSVNLSRLKLGDILVPVPYLR